MTRTEEERLAVVENQISTLQGDITEIKSDVKGLVLTQQQLAVALAVKEAAEFQSQKARAQNGVWVRWLLPLMVTLGSAVVTVAGLLRGI
jgi:hypothetical protein